MANGKIPDHEVLTYVEQLVRAIGKSETDMSTVVADAGPL